jgi:dipeptidase E
MQMRLYLSSYRLGDSAGALLALVGNGARAAIVSNALDHIPAAAREAYRAEISDPIADFAALGISAQDLDLKHYFGAPDRLENALRGVDLVWAMGGNSFILRRAMAQSGFDTVITELLAHDGIVYGGFSAGAVVATPSLSGVELMDDPNVIPPGYDPAVVWEGLSLVDYAIVPHFDSPHPESVAARAMANQLAKRKTPFRALRDGEVIVHIGKISDTKELAL